MKLNRRGCGESHLDMPQQFVGYGTQAGTAMVATWAKAASKRNAATQTVVPRKQIGAKAFHLQWRTAETMPVFVVSCS